MIDRLKALSFGVVRALLKWMTRPKSRGVEALTVSGTSDPLAGDPGAIVYALANRSLTDLVMLDIVAAANGLPRPLSSLGAEGIAEQRRFFFLNRSVGGLLQRNLMRTYSKRLLRLQPYFKDTRRANIRLVPVSVFWSRAPNKEKSLIRVLLSENWTLTSRFRRLVVILFNRRDITVQFGAPLNLLDLEDPNLSDAKLVRRIARLLRVHFKNQRTALLGPDLSHRRTLITQILASRRVREAIRSESARTDVRFEKLVARARRDARGMASDVSYITIRFFDRLLTWFWTRIYDGVDVTGLERVQRFAETSSLVYVPCHRSHVDYLLLSYLLYNNGLMIPHIAAGDNLNMPVIGGMLRRAGAFFMRRRFADDRVYSAVFNEYLFQIFRRGSPVEYFIEGGRSRTGRMLPPRTGLLNMTLAIRNRGISRPMVFVPVYIGYERLIEATSYLSELRGSAKSKESIADLFRTARVLKENFGRVSVNFGVPIEADQFFGIGAEPTTNPALDLGIEILKRINDCATINPINLIALVTLSTPKFAMDEQLLADQLDCFASLLRSAPSRAITVTALGGTAMIRHAEHLGMLDRESHPFGDVLCHRPDMAVLMTWYRNNSVHCLAMPSLIACLIINRRLPLRRPQLARMMTTVYPYLAGELYASVPTSIAAEVEAWLQLLLAEGLLVETPEGALAPPPPDTSANYRLELLGAVVMQTLERFFIVIAILRQMGQGRIGRDTLEQHCHQVARRISRLQGLNAPEFFDPRLFQNFVDALIAHEAVSLDDTGKLHFAPVVTEVTRAASAVLPASFRHTVLRARLADGQVIDAAPR